MPLLDRWRRRPPTPTPHDGFLHPPPRVLRADGQRIDLTARDAGTRLALTRQEWQTDAWTYRDMIGELRYAQRLLARSVSKARFFAAEIRPYPEPPIELSGNDHHLEKRLAAEAVENLARLPLDDGPDGFVALLTENLETAGEAWIHGEPDTGNGEQWTVRSVSEIVGAGDQIMLAELPSLTTMGQRVIDPIEEELLRCWTRHPRWGQLADSPLRAMLDVLEEVVLTGREMRAAARSRIASNGVLLLPNSLALLRTREDEETLLEQGVLENDFMRDFTEALTAPIRNEGDAGAVVPLILRGDAEALKEVRHLSLVRDDATKLMERLQGAVLRMLQGLDIQPEQVQGIGSTNHWGGWQIEASNVRHQVDPTCGTVSGCFTKAFLRPALTALGHPTDQVRKIGVWYDLTDLVESPDRSQDARDAWDRDAISDTALREALGFADDAAPESHEHLIRLLSRGRLTPQAVPLVAALSGVDLHDPAVQNALAIAVGLNPNSRTVPGQVTRSSTALPSGSSANPAEPGQVVPEQPTPTPPESSTPPAVTAAGGPPSGWRVDLDSARTLTDIDASLTDRIVTAADATITRAVERAGGRVRNAARKDKTLAASLEGIDTTLVAATLGRTKVTGFVNVHDLLAGAYQRLGEQFEKWLTQSAVSVADVTLRFLGLTPGSAVGKRTRDTITTRLAVHRPAAWAALTTALDTATEKALFRVDPLTPDPTPGERTDSLLSPQDVTRALVIAGGGTPGREGDTGFSTGPVVHSVLSDHGGVLLGWEWNYRPQIPRGSHFPPHQLLDGTRFTTWTDPKLDTTPESAWIGAYHHPQDHAGCFVAGTVVNGPPAFGSFVRPYVGEGIELRTDSGKLLTGTTNHPILTPRGWVPMGELAEGDEVVVASRDQGTFEVDHETHQVPALIEDVAATLPMAGSVVTRPMPTTTKDFHGDGAGSDGQITVVRTDRRLLFNNKASGSEFHDDDVLQLGHKTVRPLPTESVFDPFLPWDSRTSRGGVGRRSERLPILRSASLVPSELSSSPPASGDPVGKEYSADPRPVDSVYARQLQFAGPGAIRDADRELGGSVQHFGGDNSVFVEKSPDRALAGIKPLDQTDDGFSVPSPVKQVSEVGVIVTPSFRDTVLSEDPIDRVSPYPIPQAEVLDRFTGGVTTEYVRHLVRIPLDCHVYNLSTTTGWYVANGVIVHNCLCSSTPVIAFPTDDPTGIVVSRVREARDSQRGQITARVAAEDTSAGRIGTSLQNEVETRDRIATGIEQLRAHYIEGATA